jgi:hypothetical protein
VDDERSSPVERDRLVERGADCNLRELVRRLSGVRTEVVEAQASRFSASVALRVKTISRVGAALMRTRTFTRALSKRSVARSASR